MKPPSLFRVGNAGDRAKEVLTYFQVVADRAALPVVLYCAESESGSALAVETVIELAGHPQIIGVVDGAGGPARFEMMRAGTTGVMRDVSVTAVFGGVTGRMRVKNEAVAGG